MEKKVRALMNLRCAKAMFFLPLLYISAVFLQKWHGTGIFLFFRKEKENHCFFSR